MLKSKWTSLLTAVLLTALLLGLSIWRGYSPLLGLDLQGGVEVVLQPAPDQSFGGSELDQAVEIIRNRVDALGVAEPDITRQGNNVVVQLPGVDDQERAIELVGQTAELTFRPILFGPIAQSVAEDASLEGAAFENLPEDQRSRLEDLQNGVIDDPTEVAAEELAIFTGGPAIAQTSDGRSLVDIPIYLLGPALATGSILSTASAQLLGVNNWVVSLTMRSGPEGIDLFNQAASECFSQTPTCPTSQLAIVLDGNVESAPTVDSPTFARDQIQITGGFRESEARDLALVLRYGALPLEFEDPAENGLVRSVSATLGSDSLRAGIIAGIVGISVVTLYMLLYYRILGLLAIASLALSGTMLWVVVAFLSETQGLALTLAGITGLIVALGVSLDSNVVYFEHLKEGIRNGRTIISSTNQSFPVAFKTIFWANLATLIGAAILYFITIGSVKGFALMLGIASVLDLAATYFFLRPAVRLAAARSAAMTSNKWLGLPPGMQESNMQEVNNTKIGDPATDPSADTKTTNHEVDSQKTDSKITNPKADPKTANPEADPKAPDTKTASSEKAEKAESEMAEAT